MIHWMILVWMWFIGIINGMLIYHWVRLGKRRAIKQKKKKPQLTAISKGR